MINIPVRDHRLSIAPGSDEMVLSPLSSIVCLSVLMMNLGNFARALQWSELEPEHVIGRKQNRKVEHLNAVSSGSQANVSRYVFIN